MELTIGKQCNNWLRVSSIALDETHHVGDCTRMSSEVRSTENPVDMTPELLAPAGNWDCARAAVANGADAIYFGLDQFNARLRADNFTLTDLPELMTYLHSHGVKGFVTMNTLVFTSEMAEAMEYLGKLNQAGVDGVIIQDMGLANQLSEWKKQDPMMKLELHASTQMTLSSPEGIQFVERFLVMERAVLARELSLDDIDACATETGVPLEVFVHGALCVSYSGQCLTSESLGCRSANRGECAQACRMPYTIVKDGKEVDLGERRYLLSPQDLCAVDDVAELVRMGVKSYKIEGRLKSPEYVAAVTAVYRKAIDTARGLSKERINDGDRYDLRMVFSRGFSHGWLHGTDHPRLTHGRHGKKRGVFVGTITAVGNGWVELDSLHGVPIAPGDGFVFDAGEDRNDEQGGRIWKFQGHRLLFHGKAGHIDWHRVRRGQKLWKTDDPILNARLRKTWTEEKVVIAQPIHLRCHGQEGAPLVVECPEWGVSVSSSVNLEKAEKRPLTPEVLREQLGRLGGTGFQLGHCDSDLPDGLMMPLSILNKLRRELVEALENSEAPQAPQLQVRPLPVLKNNTSPSNPATLTVLCRRVSQIAPTIEAGIKTLYLDFEDLRQYAEAVQSIRQLDPTVSVFLATPRIQKPKEKGFFKIIERAQPDGVLIRNLGAAEYFADSPLRKVGDFSLNVSNPWSADILRQQGHFERLTISYDLNASQVLDLLARTPGDWLELTIHQHMPMFHMEHCVFCTFLSQGHSFKDCGQPCEHHRVWLKDRVGQLHPLFSDVGCRNTLFNGRAQTGASFFQAFYKAGLDRYRIELLDDDPRKVRELITSYQELIEGRLSADRLAEQLDALEQLGTTIGTLGHSEL